MTPERSPAEELIARLVANVGREGARALVDDLLDSMPVVDAAALAHNWHLWARPKQLPPSGNWKSWGFLTGRRFGKTRTISEFINSLVENSPEPLIIGLAAQDEQSSIDIQVLGETGLVETSPRWFRPEWRASDMRLDWPNGSHAYVRTPEVPGKIRGQGYHLCWISELQSWPPATRDEAFANFLLSTSYGRALVLWDATPKRRHPILKTLIAEAERDPRRNIIVRGTTHENARNLADNYVAELEEKFGNTLRRREELLGEMLPESESALFREEWINRARRHPLERYVRRVVSCDPATTARKGSDTSGIVEVGLGSDGQAYVIGDYSGRYTEGWAEKAMDVYLDGQCDLMILETNKIGDSGRQLLAAIGKVRGQTIVLIDKEARPPQRSPGTIFVREVFASGSKEDRAEPVATACEKGRISHCIGSDLTSLEDTLTTWEPPDQDSKRRADSPGDLDALVHACVDLLGLRNTKPDGRVAFAGIEKMGQALAAPPKHAPQAVRPFPSTMVWSPPGAGGRI